MNDLGERILKRSYERVEEIAFDLTERRNVDQIEIPITRLKTGWNNESETNLLNNSQTRKPYLAISLAHLRNLSRAFETAAFDWKEQSYWVFSEPFDFLTPEY